MPSFRCVLLIVSNVATVFGTFRVSAQEARSSQSVAQLYFYSIKDRSSFQEGYRRHLEWHAAHKDKLVWYAWTIDTGPRSGDFADGTFGATFGELDARPEQSSDAADFVRNVSPYVVPLDSEIWDLWPSPSTATPLEERRPGTTLDVFRLQLDPGDAQSFESAIEALAKTKREASQISWYRMIRGDTLPTYLILLSRKSLSDIQSAGATLAGMLANAFATTPAKAASALAQVRIIRAETWSYEPRLALIPGKPLEP
jgi:hypothetical protein